MSTCSRDICSLSWMWIFKMKSTFPPVAILLLALCAIDASDPVVKVEQGRIIGKRVEFDTKELNLQKSLDVYLSIPYAEAPVGSLRFKPPVPKQWNGELDATQYRDICPQPPFEGLWDTERTQGEDCLSLDVFVPVPSPPNAAVMIWIHGGGYQLGTGSAEGFDFSPVAALGDVIVVAINYRLGALGFLSTGDDVVPGNMGLLDQVEAMKWVKNNIAAFGGDPDRVTIFGESAGSSSVSCHTLSPLSKGLFAGAILQSGTALSPWAANEDIENYAKRAFALGQLVNCKGDDSTQLVECLVDVPFDDMVNASQRLMEVFPEDPSMIALVPVVDGNFFPEAPSTLIEKRLFNPANIMAGYNADEATVWPLFMFGFPAEKPHINATMFEMLLTMDKTSAKFPHPLQRGAIELVYFEDSVITDTNASFFDAIVRLQGDRSYACPTETYMRGASEANVGQTYAYYLNHHPSTSFFHASWTGTAHGDDLVFFGAHFLPNAINLTDVEVDMTVKMIKYWTNFAKTGNPNMASEGEDSSPQGKDPEWPQYSTNEEMFKELSPAMKNIGNPRVEECQLWNDYLPKLDAILVELEECHQDKGCKSHWTKGKEESCISDDKP